VGGVLAINNLYGSGFVLSVRVCGREGRGEKDGMYDMLRNATILMSYEQGEYLWMYHVFRYGYSSECVASFM